MLSRRIIPCLDFEGERVVKGVNFQDLQDMGNVVELGTAYERQGADEITMLDVSATPEGRSHTTTTVRALRAQLSIPLTVGGGVRSVDDARALLDAGADKVSVNTAAVRDPSLLDRMSAEFGAQCTVLAIDAKRDGSSWQILTHSGSEDAKRDAIEWAEEACTRGVGEILLTSFDRDGTGAGYDTELLRAISSRVEVPIIASGGAATTQHLIDALSAGADAVLAASIFHRREFTVGDVKQALQDAGIEVRP